MWMLQSSRMFKKMGVKAFYIVKSIGESKRATIMLEGSENVYITFLQIQKKAYCWNLWWYLWRIKNHKMYKQLSTLLIFPWWSFSRNRICHHRYWMFFAVRAYIYIFLSIFCINNFFKTCPLWKMQKIFLCSIHVKNTVT